MTNKPGKFALEAISFQGTEFFDAVTAAVAELRAAVLTAQEKDPASLPQAKALCGVLKRYTNLNFSMLRGEYNTFIGMFYPAVSNNHVFQRVRGQEGAAKSMRSSLPKNLRELKDGFGVGKVDMRKNWVEGFFAEIPCELYISPFVLRYAQLSDRQIAAMVLHETGHAFTMFEHINRTVSTNQVLAEISAALSDNDAEKVSAIIVQTAREEKLTTAQRDALKACREPQDYVVCAYAIADERSRSDLGLSVYDITMNEQLADQYATRCGAGRDMVTGMDELYRLTGDYSRAYSKVRLTRQAFVIALEVAITSAIVGWFTGPIGALISGLIDLLVIVGGLAFQAGRMEGSPSYYDTPAVRFERIRNQMVEQIKRLDPKSPLDDHLLVCLQEVNDVIEKVREAESGAKIDALVHYAGLFFNKVYRRNYDMRVLQQQLEALASNNLFVQAARFQAL